MIEWCDEADHLKRSKCGRFELVETKPDVWRPHDTQGGYGPSADLHMGQQWCENRIALTAPDFAEPDFIVEGKQ